MIGRLISGRYLIEAVVGTGGMAVVYRARDIQLNKTVAIKVLRSEYQTDMDFVHRFSLEAEAAAKMSHENIVNMLDVGIDHEMRYIVMEYVDGRTLKEMIRQEGRIHPDVALRMAIRILAAVDHAHRNGIVHRDIKPQNILVDGEGRIKVADFGIARLKTGPTADAEGQALGSVHYLSPEQARGEVADEQSDLYSVGVVLYEMLTGQVPFDGDTPASVALKHVREMPASVRMRNSRISRALDEVVMRALCKDKKRRYQSAAEMAQDLRLTIEQPRGGFVHYPDPDESAPESNADAPVAADANAQTVDKRIDASGSGDKPAGKKPMHPGVRTALITAVVILIFVIAGGVMLGRSLQYRRMPDLLGMEQSQAVCALVNIGLQPQIVTAYSEDYASGQVMLQSCAQDEYVRKGAPVTITISLGSQWYELEDMTGWDVDRALQALDAARVRDYTVVYIQSDLPAGTVVSTDTEPGTASRDKAIELRVSGKCVSMPPLTGLTLEGAQALLRAEGLTLGTVSEGDSADAQAGCVIDQSIAPYTQVLTDTPVDITVCQTREMLHMPAQPVMLVVPLDNVRVAMKLTTPSGVSIEAMNQRMPAGTHYAEISSSEAGLHTVEIFMDDVLMETLNLYFE